MLFLDCDFKYTGIIYMWVIVFIRRILYISKSRPLRSPVWEYLEIVGEKKVCCKLCMPPENYYKLTMTKSVNTKNVFLSIHEEHHQERVA